MKKEVCLKCYCDHLKHCYSQSHNEEAFNFDWGRGKVWCIGLANFSEIEETIELCGGTAPYLKISDNPPIKYCSYLEKHNENIEMSNGAKIHIKNCEDKMRGCSNFLHEGEIDEQI